MENPAMSRLVMLLLSALLACSLGLSACDKGSGSEPVTTEDKTVEKEQNVEKKADSVTIGDYVPQKGDKTRTRKTNKTDMEMKISMTMKGATETKEEKSKDDEVEEKDVEVLEVKDGKVTSIKVTYRRATKVKTETKEGETKDRTINKPYAGKTYTVTLDGDNSVVVDDKGGEPPKDEMEAVQKDNKLGKDYSGLDDAIPDGPIKFGQKIDLPAEKLAKLLGTDDPEMKDALKVNEFSFTLKETKKVGDREAAIFDTVMSMQVNMFFTMKFELKGESAIDIKTGRMLSMKLAGPIEIPKPKTEEKEAAMKIEGSGNMAMEHTNTYE